MVRNTTQNVFSLSVGDFRNSFIYLFILLFICFDSYASKSIPSTSLLCPDVDSPSVDISNLNGEIISEACGGDLIAIEIILADNTEEITSFLFFQDINSNNQYDTGEELAVNDFEINGSEAVFRLTSINPGQIYFSIIVGGCSEYNYFVNDFEFITCGLEREQSCFCLDNATINDDGEFIDSYTFSSYVGNELIVRENSGAIDPEDQDLYPVGFVFTSDIDGIIEFSVEHVDGIGYELLLENGNGQVFALTNSCNYPDPEINLAGGYCTNHPDINIIVSATGYTGEAEIFLNGNPITVFSPSSLGEGMYTLEYSFSADSLILPSISGCTAHGSIEIEVFGDSPPSLVCNSFLNLSLSSAGFFVLTPDVIISDNGSTGCYASFDLEIFGQDHDTIFCSQIGDHIFAVVTDPATNSSCFSTITVFDKSGPVITGQDTVRVNCSIDENDPSLSAFIEIADNCSSQVNLIYEDYHFNFFFCDSNDPSLVKQYIRKYTATDEHGNISVFEQLIQFIRPDISEIEFPLDTILSCDIDQEFLSAENVGEPSFGDVPVSLMNCIYQVTYTDMTIPAGCSGREGIRRLWNVLDPCTAISVNFAQDITFMDNIKPVIICPDTMYLSMDPGNCLYNFVLHEPVVSDNCSDDLLVFTLYENSIVFSDNIDLPVGEHRFTVYANDLCGNLDSCSYVVNIMDNENPVIDCEPTIAIIDESGEVTIGLHELNFQVGDNCDISDTLVRRANISEFGTELYFTCNDVQQSVEIIIQVTDMSGNITEVECLVIVEDNINPIINCGTAFSPIDCSEIPFNLNDLFPIPDFSDNCIIGSTENDIVTVLDDCLEGTITRTFSAIDISGNSNSCQQIIIVENNSVLTESDIEWPEAILLEACLPVTDVSITGSPVFDNMGFCTEIQVIFNDTEDFDDTNNCIVIEREWEITDVCSFSKSGGTSGTFTFVQTITTRPADYDLVVPADITVSADDNCEAFVELTPAFAFNCIQDITITNTYDTDLGAFIYGNFERGITEIEFSAIDGCGNMKSESVFITVEDNTAPEIGYCPSDITINCADDISDLSIYGEIIASDNCGIVNITEEIDFDTETCGSGVIVRTWTVTDHEGNSSTCVQNIIVEGPDPLIFSDINWPEDTVVSGCTPDYDPEVLGEPLLPAEDCRIVEITFVDTDITDMEGCMFLERNWTVTDHCDLYVPGENIFTYSQVIYSYDNRDFEFLIDSVFSSGVDPGFCEAYFDIILEIQGQCESAVDVFWEIVYSDNSIQSGTGRNVSGFYPVGITTINFSADTECFGNKTVTAEVIVEDNEAPVITVVPGDITISCTNMSFDITDGFDAFDPCGIAMSFIEIDTLIIDQCGIGIYRVSFTAIDVNGNSSTEFRLVEFFGDMDGIGIEDFNALQDTIDIECGTVPINTGELTYIGLNRCIPVEISFSDEVDNSQPGYCAVITRTWTAFSPCNAENSMVEVIQVIRITEDNDVPDLSGIQDTIIYVGENTCEAEVLYNETYINECLIRRITNDSPFAYSNEGLPNGSYPPGNYVVEITAEDYCDNISFKSIVISVIDNAPPSILCDSGLELSLEIDGELEIHIDELAGIFPICEGDYLTFSSMGDVTDTTIIFDCLNLGFQELTVYAFDVAGNSSFCVQTINIVDLELSCGGIGGIISGAIHTAYGEAIENVIIEAKSSELIISKENLSGEYSFNLLLNRDYVIGADKSDEMNNGVTILDLIILAQYIIENRQFETPYHYIAADVNNDKKINFMDLVEMRSVMMRRQDYFTGGKAWRFVPQDWDMSVGEHVLKSDIPDHIEVKNLEGELRDQNFIGIKVGDLNNSAVTVRSSANWTYEVFEKKGSITSVRIYPDNRDSWLGMDLNFYVPMGSSLINFSFIGGAEQSEIITDGNLLNNSMYKLIVFSALPIHSQMKPAYLEVEILNMPDDFDFDLLFGHGSEAVSGDFELFDISFLRREIEKSEKSRVYPNPFNYTSVIEVTTGQEEKNVVFSIIDKTGRDIYKEIIHLSEGKNRIEINSGMISVSGVYFYRMQMNAATLQGQIIKID